MQVETSSAAALTSADPLLRELEHENALLRSMLDAAVEGVLVLDNHGRIIRYNKRFLEMWRVPAAVIEGADDVESLVFALEQLEDPVDYAKLGELFDKLDCASCDIVEFEDGRCFERYADRRRLNGSVIGHVWRFVDITERKHAESLLARRATDLESMNRELRDTHNAMSDLVTEARQLREELEHALSRLEAIYRSAPMGIALLDEHGRVLDANPAMRELIGDNKTSILDRLHPEEADAARELSRVIERQSESCQLEARYIRDDREPGWLELAATGLAGAAPGASLTLAVAYDITQHHIAEQQLRQAQKIEAIGQLSAGIAHDFNNLLMGMLGYVELARNKASDDSMSCVYLEKAASAGQRAASLTRQLLAFGRKQAFHLETLDINALVLETLDLLARLLGENILIRVELAPELEPIRSDATQLQQAVLNIALNARDAMPAGGSLVFETRMTVLADGDAAALEVAAGDFVVLSMSDTGVGMPPEIKDRIFEPFFTTKEVGEGSGLGLSSVFGIVKQSHGAVCVESTPNVGTTFEIYLPAA